MKKLLSIVLSASYLLLANHCAASVVFEGSAHNCMASAMAMEKPVECDACAAHHDASDSNHKPEGQSNECCTTVFQNHPTLIKAPLSIAKPILLAENLAVLDETPFVSRTAIVSNYRDHGPPGHPDCPSLFFPSLLRAPPSYLPSR